MKLIFGANGQLGIAFKELFTNLGEEYIATDIGEADITNIDFLKAYINTMCQNYKIDTIINCAAYTDVDKAEEEQELCYKVNMEGAVNLATISQELGINYITYSTNFVFSGEIEDYLYNDNNVGYTELDEPNPLSAYSQSKREAEILISNLIEAQEKKSKIYLIRTSWLFGRGRLNFIKKIVDLSRTEEEIKVVDDQISSPTYTKDLAEFTNKLLEANAESGLYHFSNDGFVSKYELAKYILEKISWNGYLEAVKTEEFGKQAKRPNFSKLNCKKIKETLGATIPHWKDAVDRYLKEIS
ncbi:MAG: dTDP-4-dehydrorhamnose reductase [Fusobacterium sp.]|nr:dTDP-4-dehydrorhamnose reductase [Fusobacterium sp.]